MKRVIYTSTAGIPLNGDIIADILDVSHRNNETYDVTGVLLCGGSHFIQVLEGEDETVDKLCMAIEQAPRHRDFDIIFDEPIVERAFSKWTMAYSELDQAAIKSLGISASKNIDELIAVLRTDEALAGRFIFKCAADLTKVA